MGAFVFAQLVTRPSDVRVVNSHRWFRSEDMNKGLWKSNRHLKLTNSRRSAIPNWSAEFVASLAIPASIAVSNLTVS